MIRTYKCAARPLASQRQMMAHWLVMCCILYNNCLEQRILWWKKAKKGLTAYDQYNQLTELREADPEWRAFSVMAARSAIDRLQRAFDDFFRRCKSGEKPGFPRFKSRDRYGSFGIGRCTIKIGTNNEAFVRVPKLGWLRFKLSRAMLGEVRNVEIGRDCKGRWFVHVACDIGEAPAKCMIDPRRTVGVDVGLTSLATLDNGEKIENPRWLRRAAERLTRAQRVLSFKPKIPFQKNSRSRERAKKAVARAHAKIANCRKNHHFHVAGMLVKRWDLICFEGLRITTMVHGNLAKSILDAGWGQLISITACKAEWAGKHVIEVDPRGTSQECSSCGAIVSKTLSDRVHACSCGCVLDRDENAGLNIKARGLRAVPREFLLPGAQPCY